jgi:hypothetical protein
MIDGVYLQTLKFSGLCRTRSGGMAWSPAHSRRCVPSWALKGHRLLCITKTISEKLWATQLWAYICFTNSPEDGCAGYAISLNLNRCQGFKVCRKTAKEVTKNAVIGRNESKNNAIKHNKGDLILQDCNVTDTDTGTPSNPKFALKGLWEDCLLPQLDALVAVDGPCAGAIVCHQEDNAGPHKEGQFHQWLEAEFKRRNWQLELQAPIQTCSTYNFSLSCLRDIHPCYSCSQMCQELGIGE